MSLNVTVRDSTTDYIDFDLLSNNIGINLTAVDHIEMKLKTKGGTVTTYSTADASPQLFITDAANGRVQFRPTSTDLIKTSTPYHGYFWVYVTTTRKYAVPEAAEFKIEVREKY